MQERNKDYFWESSKIGNIGIDIVKTLLSNDNITVQDMQKDTEYMNKDIDLISFKNGYETLIEVKTDTYFDKTGNLFIEENANDGPGWLYKTRSNYVYYVFPEHRVYVIYVEEFKAWFEQNRDRFTTKTSKTTDKHGNFWYYSIGKVINHSIIDELDFIYYINLEPSIKEAV